MALKTKEKKVLDVTDLFLKRSTAKLLAAIVRANSYHHFHIHKVCSSFFFIFWLNLTMAKSMLNILRGFFSCSIEIFRNNNNFISVAQKLIQIHNFFPLWLPTIRPSETYPYPCQLHK